LFLIFSYLGIFIRVSGSGKEQPMQQSVFLKTMSGAIRAGKAVLAEIRDNRSRLTAIHRM
jgi:hypothetical protein